MLRPICDIEIGKNKFNFVTLGSFSSSWKTFTDTGKIKLPNKFKKEDKVIYVGKKNLFRKGDVVNVNAGYFPNKEAVFSGYVTGVKTDIPVEIKLEDANFILKQTNLTLSFKKVTLKELLSHCIEEAKKDSKGYVLEGLNKIKLNVVDAKLGAFRLTNVSISKVLEELKKTYALTSYFRGNILNVGLAYNKENTKRVKLFFQEDIIDDGTNLEFLEKDDVSFKVKAISMLENNKKIEIEVGDKAGEQRTITKYNLSKKELKEVAIREKDKLHYTGFRGAIKTFMKQIVYHGDEIELIDKKQPEKNGVYLVEEAEYEIGVEGYFQTIKLGVKVG